MKKVEVEFMLGEGGKAPKQGIEEDFGTDLYTSEDVLIVPSAIEATLVGAGIHTAFDPKQHGMFISLRSSMSKLPISMANHVGVIEGTYRGEIKVPLRNTLSISLEDKLKGTPYVLVWNEKGKSLDTRLVEEIAEELREEVINNLLDEMVLLGLNTKDNRRLLADLIIAERLPRGTVLIEKGSRVAQAYLINKHTIDWVERKELTETERGYGGFGSTNE